MKKIFLSVFLFFLLFYANIKAQNVLGLNDCYDLLTKNYPLSKQKELLNQSSELNKQSLQQAVLPNLSFNAQATYQSDVTAVPIKIPKMEIPVPNKDQYKAVLNIDQTIYAGGIVKTSMKMQDITNELQQGQLETSLYQLKNQVNQLYFNILLLQEKNQLLDTLKKSLEVKRKEIRSAVENGIMLSSADDIISAEILKTEQQSFELKATKDASLQMLSKLLNTNITTNTLLQKPEISLNAQTTLLRPELKVFESQKQQIDISSTLLNIKNTPKFAAFMQGGYGNPGLNMLDNSFQPFYITGVRFNWNVWDWSITKKQKQVLDINKKIIDNLKEVFELNTNVTLTQQQSEISKSEQLIQSDKEIITLRKKIVSASESQLRNGTITFSQYFTELTALNQAEIDYKTHEIQLLLAKANYKITSGN